MSEAKAKVSKPKPKWWKPYWIILVIITIALGVAIPFFTYVPLERATIGLILTLLCIGFAYYIRIRPSIRINRALYILLGTVVIGFFLWIALMILLTASGINRLIANTFGDAPSATFGITSFIACYVTGAFIGDWIGKKVNYRILFSL